MHSSSNYCEAARSQLEMEEQRQNAPRATYGRASLRVVRTTAWSHAASQLGRGFQRTAAETRGALPAVPSDRGLRIGCQGVVLAIETGHSALQTTAASVASAASSEFGVLIAYIYAFETQRAST